MKPIHRAAVVAALLTSVLAGCLESDKDDDDPAPAGASPLPGAVRFVALGDMGTGDETQARVAEAIESVCAARGCDFAVGLGDMIYPGGAASPDDPQFDAKFEVPYARLAFPFWNVLGNHDNGQDPLGTGITDGLGLWYDTGNNEVAYAQRADRASDKWHMPARHYTFNSGAADVVALDTNTMMFYGVPVSVQIGAEIQAQENWLSGDAFAGDSEWTIAIGHHPYLSNGPHGDAGEYDGRAVVPGASGDHFKAVFEAHCDKIDLFLAGHDHNLQWLEPNAACPTTQLIVSGGGGADTYPIEGGNPARFETESHGFWWIEIQGATLRALAFDDQAALLFEGFFTK